MNLPNLTKAIRELNDYSLDDKALINSCIEKIPEYYLHKDEIFNNLFLVKIVGDEMNLEPESCIASIVYQFCTDDFLSNENFMNQIHPEIYPIVSGLNKIPIFDVAKYKSQPENFIRFILTLVDDGRAILIKIAEMLMKIRNFNLFKESEKKTIVNEVSYLYVSIAHRLGLYKIKTEMEESAMKILHYDIYKHIANRLSETKSYREKYINDFVNPIKEILSRNGIENFEVKGRPKSIASIWNKMKSQNVDVDGVYDLFAIRVIVDTELKKEKEICWKVYSLITEKYQPNPYRLRDWITMPKSSGYESLHTTVIGPDGKWIEVQIRTKRMDEIAESGLAAHWKYKSSGKKTDGALLFGQIRAALENNSIEHQLTKRQTKASLYTDEIFVFTDKGDLKRMKQGDSVLDFAFQIHTEIGSKCKGAIINNRFVSIRYILKNGDHAKILTGANQRPTKEWEDIVQNQRIKNKIRRILKLQENKWTEIGKDIVKQKLKQLGLDLEDTNINKLVKYFKCTDNIELYCGFGEGKLDPVKIKKAFETTENKLVTKKTESIAKKETESKPDFLIIDQINSIDYQFAKCCNPILGDKIFAFVTISKGTKIHRTDCPNAKQLQENYPYRIIKAVWKTDESSSAFAVNIRIEGKNSIGILNEITKIISQEYKLNIRNLKLQEKPGDLFEGSIELYVSGKKQLESVIKRLKTVKNIQRVSRELG